MMVKPFSDTYKEFVLKIPYVVVLCSSKVHLYEKPKHTPILIKHNNLSLYNRSSKTCCHWVTLKIFINLNISLPHLKIVMLEDLYKVKRDFCVDTVVCVVTLTQFIRSQYDAHRTKKHFYCVR